MTNLTQNWLKNVFLCEEHDYQKSASKIFKNAIFDVILKFLENDPFWTIKHDKNEIFKVDSESAKDSLQN